MVSRFALALLLSVTMLPDEGQWLPTQVRNMDWPALQKRGMKLSRDEFWHPAKGGVLSATVQINGCTASFCSPDGLLVTNHHCGFGAVTALSTPEQNHLRDGFAAATLEQELPAPGMVASVLKRIENVTDRVHAAQAEADSDLERYQATQATLSEIVREAEASEPNTACSVASFLEGKEYHLYYRTRITDVRLVYAPPRAIGEYGGDTDNWEWPRHTGDFTFFRAYVAPDGSVRRHNKENVPFQPEHSLKVSTEGVVENDLAIIMGYPGSTQRYKSSRAVAFQHSYVYPTNAAVLKRGIDVLKAASKTSEQKALEFVNRIKSLENVEKMSRGMVFGLQNNGTVAHKLEEERQFAKWVAADRKRKASYGSVLDELLAMDAEEEAVIERDTMIGLTFRLARGNAPLLGILIEACANPAGRMGRVVASDRLTADFELVQQPLIAILIDEYAAMSDAQRFDGMAFLGETDWDDGAGQGVLAATKMTDAAARRELFAGGAEAVAASEDPLIVIARALAKERAAYLERRRERSGKMLDLGRRWIEAQEAFRGKSFYPDANSTLRVSIAEVKSYSPRDGVLYTPHTTVGGILAKHTGEAPFDAPKALRAAASKRAGSRWVDPRLGDVPVCFLTNGDTTGGNSGSPVIDGSGRLIGLNFDRVFEGVATDFGWHPARSRNVIVDIRYALWVIDEVFPCERLLAELDAAK